MQGQSYRPDIDGLRAVAVLAVIAYHAFPESFPGGFTGVDIFFVISGYLITGILASALQNGTFSFAHFYARRLRRIFPALICMMSATAVFGWFTLLAEEYKEFAKYVMAGAAFASNLVLWQEAGYFDTAAESKPLLHLWSLGVEEQFYILWPCALFLAWKWRHRLLAPVAILGAASFLHALYLSYIDPTAAFYSPLARAWEIFLGALLALSPAIVRSRQQSHIAAATGSALIAAGFLLIDRASVFPGVWALLPSGGAVLIISAGPSAATNKILATPVMAAIGLISYPLYLWHWPVLVYARISLSEPPSAALRATLIALSFVLATLTYILVERPLRHRTPSSPMIVRLSSAMALIAILSFHIWFESGFPSRVPKLLQAPAPSERPWREHLCYLQDDLGDKNFPDIQACIEPAKPTVVLFGDSLAAMLYPGLRALQQDHSFGIAQFTANNCWPSLEGSPKRKHCDEINKLSLDQIEKIKPETVLLAARWNEYPLESLGPFANALKERGAKQIIVIGPLPQWTGSLKRQLWLHARRNFFEVPERLNGADDPQMRQISERLAAETSRLGLKYVASYGYLCNDSGCLARLGDAPEDLMMFDHDHLTTRGSEHFLRAIASEIIPLQKQ